MNSDEGPQRFVQLLSSGSDARVLALIAVAYYLGAELAFAIGTLSDRIFAPFWPPNIILLCALLSTSSQRWWLYILAVFPPHVVAELGVGMSWLQLLVAFATNCLFAILCAFGLRCFHPGPPWLATFNNTMVYVLVAAGASPAVSALGGAFVRVAGGGDLANYWVYWEQWYLANALASVTLGAAFLTWMDTDRGWPELVSRTAQGEALLLTLGLVTACLIAFQGGTSTPRNFLPGLLYLPLPLVLWAAVRFRVRGGSAAILVITISSIVVTLHGSSVFVGAEAEDNVMALQLFLTAIAIPVLLLAASVDGLRRAENTAVALAGSILDSQDEERRRVAKTLHDSIAQDLLAAAWIADDVQRKLILTDQKVAEPLKNILHKSITDVRQASYQLHPSLLEHGGLPLAVRALAMDHHRAGLAVIVDVPDDLGRFLPQIELAAFRVVEEGLASVRQHSGSEAARVRIQHEAFLPQKTLHVTVEELGGGVSNVDYQLSGPHVSALSLARMRERLRGVRGKLEIGNLRGTGTLLDAFIPTS